jgi:hypothetical protein
MIVSHLYERLGSEHGIGARSVLDDDRLLPAFAKRIRKRPRGDVRRNAWAERRDDPDRSLRPISR